MTEQEELELFPLEAPTNYQQLYNGLEELYAAWKSVAEFAMHNCVGYEEDIEAYRQFDALYNEAKRLEE